MLKLLREYVRLVLKEAKVPCDVCGDPDAVYTPDYDMAMCAHCYSEREKKREESEYEREQEEQDLYDRLPHRKRMQVFGPVGIKHYGGK